MPKTPSNLETAQRLADSQTDPLTLLLLEAPSLPNWPRTWFLSRERRPWCIEGDRVRYLFAPRRGVEEYVGNGCFRWIVPPVHSSAILERCVRRLLHLTDGPEKSIHDLVREDREMEGEPRTASTGRA